MSTKAITTGYRDTIAVLDDYGAPIAIRVEADDGQSVHLNISVDEAREIARALNAFAEIHTRT